MQMEVQHEWIDIPRGVDRLAEAEKAFFSNLKWQVLFCLLEKNGHLSISDMSRKAGLSIHDVVLALESMELMKIITKTEQGYVQKGAFVKRIGSNLSDRIEIMSQYVLSSAQANNRILETATSAQHKTHSLTYNSNKTLIGELVESINKALEEFKRKSDSQAESWDNVYNLSYSVVEMIEGKL